MWFMPSWGRPERLSELLAAPGGWPSEVNVLVNRDDPRYSEYRLAAARPGPWVIRTLDEGTRCADAHRFASQLWANEPFYGLLCDDQWPVTVGWHEALVKAAGTKCIAGPSGTPEFPLLRTALVLGGDLVRAMGSLVPPPVKHNFEDNFWDEVAADFNILRPVPEHIVEHRHWLRGEAAKDATYLRGSQDFEVDRGIWEQWRQSEDCLEMKKRVAKLLGSNLVEFDTDDFLLDIVVPVQDENVCGKYHKSILHTLMDLQANKIKVRISESTGGSHIGKARERVIWNAMKREPKATHFLCIDADMDWDPKVVMRLLAADHEFSAVVGVRKTEEVRFCVNFFDEQVFHPKTHFLKVRDVGFAFVLLKRSVIEKIHQGYPELHYVPYENGESALFLDMMDDGERLSEDFSFCRRWTRLGGEIWVDPSSEIGHVGTKTYTGRLDSLFVMKNEEAA